ncbi:LysM peptidoglycan-binding domain-containing protein [Devosia sp. CAU 1758]
MGQCLRGKMAEVGLIPAAPAPQVADVAAPAAETAASIEEAVPAEPALDVIPAAPAEADAEAEAEADVDQLVAATFGLLRAEPDGSVVIAGSGRPGSNVQVFANGELLGTVEVEASGDWVFVPDAPLPPGGLEITLGEEGIAGTADDSFIVVIDEDKTSQPLVVASKPGEASEVLQGLTAPTAMAEASEPMAPLAPVDEPPAAEPEPARTEMASAPEEEPLGAESSAMTAAVEPEETSSAEPSEDQSAAEPVEESAMQVAELPTPAASAPDAAAPGSEAAATANTPAAPAPEPAATATTPAAPAPEPAATATTPVAPAPVAELPTAAEAPTPAEEPVAIEPPEAAVDEEPAPAITAVPAAEPAPAGSVQLADVPPSIDAIEIETDRTFFAGAGPDGGIVRLYVDDAFVADTVIEGGRWLIEAGPVLGKPTQRVRVDLLPPNSASVIARAEVDFVVDVPTAEEPVAIAEAPAAAPETEPEPEPAGTAAQESAAEPVAEPAAEPASTLQPAPAVIAEATPATEPAAAAEPAAATEPAAAAEPAATAEPVTELAPAPKPAAVAQTPTELAPQEPSVPTMVAVSLGDPETQRFVSGKAIIRRGDNLWTIARRVYGEGLKYTTIYQANTGQIRDPDRIYPGQVFDLPEGLLAQ